MEFLAVLGAVLGFGFFVWNSIGNLLTVRAITYATVRAGSLNGYWNAVFRHIGGEWSAILAYLAAALAFMIIAVPGVAIQRLLFRRRIRRDGIPASVLFAAVAVAKDIAQGISAEDAFEQRTLELVDLGMDRASARTALIQTLGMG